MIDVSECKASIWFHGEGLDPDWLSGELSCAPTYSIKRGEFDTDDEGNERPSTKGRWQLTSGWRPGETLDEVITGLLAQLPDDLKLWSKLCAQFRGELFCALLLGQTNQETRLRPTTLMAIAERGLALHLDIYGAE